MDRGRQSEVQDLATPRPRSSTSILVAGRLTGCTLPGYTLTGVPMLMHAATRAHPVYRRGPSRHGRARTSSTSVPRYY